MTGHELKQLRLKTEMSQHKLSQKIGIHLKTLQRWERKNWKIQGKYLPKIRGIFNLAAKESTKSNRQEQRKRNKELLKALNIKYRDTGDWDSEDPLVIEYKKGVGVK